MPQVSASRWRGTFAVRGAAMAAVLLASASVLADSPPPADGPPMVKLSDHGLTVTVALPDARHGFYRSTRFDWSGMITGVTFGGHAFYGPWFDATAETVRDYLDDGQTLTAGTVNAATGPVDEFVPPQGEAPPGYAETAVGGTFLKIGVGRLVRPDDKAYDRFRPYAIAGGTVWKVARRGRSIRFVQHIAADSSGYGYTYEKVITLAPGGLMTLAHRLTNIGTKPFRTQVYNHNFTRFDGLDSGPPLSIETPWQLGPVPAKAIGLAETDGGTIRLAKPLPAGAVVSLPVPAVPADVASARFVFRGAGAAVSISGDHPLARAQIWAIRKAVAVEPFILLDLPPGASRTWTWDYRFSAP